MLAKRKSSFIIGQNSPKSGSKLKIKVGSISSGRKSKSYFESLSNIDKTHDKISIVDGEKEVKNNDATVEDNTRKVVDAFDFLMLKGEIHLQKLL